MPNSDGTARGFGHCYGFDDAPAVIVIDFMRAFTDATSPLGSDLSTEIAASNQVIEAAREAGRPVVFTVSWYRRDLADAGVWKRKVPTLSTLPYGSPAVEIDPRVDRRADDDLIVKKYASAFYGTDLASRLTAARISSVLVVGCTTSGCVRATTVDAMQHGFAPIVVREGVGDRWPEAHAQALSDIDQKYADVVDLSDALDGLAAHR